MAEKQENKPDRYAELINRFIKRIKTDGAFRAAFKSADNADMEHRCWEYLAFYVDDIENRKKRRPYTTVLAAIARNKDISVDGKQGLGEALLAASGYDRENSSARMRLRRILACADMDELCSVLRPMLNYIYGKGADISYSRLLKDIIWFEKDTENTKARWARQFFSVKKDNQEDNQDI
ncbi:MAG: type I-E CRISPR-associated protein Cse2/CasB [Elusimicrobiales bacterium]|nr:type I-E CRISPR-associated protein Cse2/CasB [Elusimicrobiales bacterium]